MDREEINAPRRKDNPNFVNDGNKSYWDKVRAGEIEHNGRGSDNKPRKTAVKSMKSFEKKYYEKTGRTIFQDMKEQQEEIEEMKELARATNDPDDKFNRLMAVNTMRDKYNRLWSPYLQAKKGVITTDVKDEETESLDDILDEE